MHFLWIKSLVISYKNQPLLLSQGGCLEQKNRQISGELRFSFRTKC